MDLSVKCGLHLTNDGIFLYARHSCVIWVLVWNQVHFSLPIIFSKKKNEKMKNTSWMHVSVHARIMCTHRLAKLNLSRAQAKFIRCNDQRSVQQITFDKFHFDPRYYFKKTHLKKTPIFITRFLLLFFFLFSYFSRCFRGDRL